MNLSKLAKHAVEIYIKEKRIVSSSFATELLQMIKCSEDLQKEFLEKKAGTFVTIEKNGDLRGCVGTYLPTRKNIAEEIIFNAIAAATEDHRFCRIEKEELHHLCYTVYILSKPESVKDLKELDPKKYGIIVKGLLGRSGLLLPDLEGVDTIERQILIACHKGGIDPTQEKCLIYKFTVKKYQ